MALGGAQFNAKHARGAGGLFAATSAASGKPTGAWARGPLQSGAAHGGTVDPRAKAMQLALNRAGITDERGRPLLVDGKPGPHTSAAVKKWQQAHGMKPTGTVDAKTMVALLSAKPPAKKPSARSRMRAPARKPAAKRTPAKKRLTSAQKTAAAKLALADKRGQSRLGG